MALGATWVALPQSFWGAGSSSPSGQVKVSWGMPSA